MKRRRVVEETLVSGWGGGKISQRENHPEHVQQHRQMVDAAKKATILPIILWLWWWQLMEHWTDYSSGLYN